MQIPPAYAEYIGKYLMQAILWVKEIIKEVNYDTKRSYRKK